MYYSSLALYYDVRCASDAATHLLQWSSGLSACVLYTCIYIYIYTYTYIPVQVQVYRYMYYVLCTQYLVHSTCIGNSVS